MLATVPLAAERPGGGQRDSQSTIRVDSSLVLVQVSVTDSQNRPVMDLSREMFRVFEGNVEQSVVHFSSEDAPISVAVVFDRSGSMSSSLSSAREAVARFLDTANPQDEFSLVEFSDRPRVVVPFTGTAEEIQDRLLSTEAGGKTALLDAVRLALDTLRGAHNPRKALLVISDGGDNDSRYRAEELRDVLREADARIYSIGIFRQSVMLPEEEPAGPHLLAMLSEETGGRQFAVRDRRELAGIGEKIGLELHNQYLLGFRPPQHLADGRYHTLQVKITGKRGLRVSFRRGYYDRQD